MHCGGRGRQLRRRRLGLRRACRRVVLFLRRRRACRPSRCARRSGRVQAAPRGQQRNAGVRRSAHVRRLRVARRARQRRERGERGGAAWRTSGAEPVRSREGLESGAGGNGSHGASKRRAGAASGGRAWADKWKSGVMVVMRRRQKGGGCEMTHKVCRRRAGCGRRALQGSEQRRRDLEREATLPNRVDAQYTWVGRRSLRFRHTCPISWACCPRGHVYPIDM